MTLAFTGAAGELLVEVPGKCTLVTEKAKLQNTSPQFREAAAVLAGQTVREVTYDRGLDITLHFRRPRALSVSLAEGDYPGTHALLIKGPGASFVSYHCDGLTQLPF